MTRSHSPPQLPTPGLSAHPHVPLSDWSLQPLPKPSLSRLCSADACPCASWQRCGRVTCGEGTQRPLQLPEHLVSTALGLQGEAGRLSWRPTLARR